MYKYFIHIISVILTSFYFFPFETVALPGVNTKMVLAGVSLLILGKRLAQRRDADINKDFSCCRCGRWGYHWSVW